MEEVRDGRSKKWRSRVSRRGREGEGTSRTLETKMNIGPGGEETKVEDNVNKKKLTYPSRKSTCCPPPYPPPYPAPNPYPGPPDPPGPPNPSAWAWGICYTCKEQIRSERKSMRRGRRTNPPGPPTPGAPGIPWLSWWWWWVWSWWRGSSWSWWLRSWGRWWKLDIVRGW